MKLRNSRNGRGVLGTLLITAFLLCNSAGLGTVKRTGGAASVPAASPVTLQADGGAPPPPPPPLKPSQNVVTLG